MKTEENQEKNLKKTENTPKKSEGIREEGKR